MEFDLEICACCRKIIGPEQKEKRICSKHPCHYACRRLILHEFHKRKSCESCMAVYDERGHLQTSRIEKCKNNDRSLQISASPAFPNRCRATTSRGEQCKRKTKNHMMFCWNHEDHDHRTEYEGLFGGINETEMIRSCVIVCKEYVKRFHKYPMASNITLQNPMSGNTNMVGTIIELDGDELNIDGCVHHYGYPWGMDERIYFPVSVWNKAKTVIKNEIIEIMEVYMLIDLARIVSDFEL